MEKPSVLGPDDIIDFGKYKGATIREIVEKDWHYIEWAVLQSQRLYVDIEAVVAYHDTCVVRLQPDDLMPFGKYKGQTLASVYAGKAMQLRPFLPGKIVPLGHNTVAPFGPNSINQLYPKVCQRFFCVDLHTPVLV